MFACSSPEKENVNPTNNQAIQASTAAFASTIPSCPLTTVTQTGGVATIRELNKSLCLQAACQYPIPAGSFQANIMALTNWTTSQVTY